MALYSDLPVYKSTYDLLLAIFRFTKDFGKEYKYTVGERLKNETTDMLINIYKSNKSKKETRTQYIDNARQNVEVVRLLLLICKDLKVIGMKGFCGFKHTSRRII